MMSLGKVIRRERKRKEMRQSDLAHISGLSQWNISRYEKDIVVPSFIAMCYLADALGTDLNTIKREWEEGVEYDDE